VGFVALAIQGPRGPSGCAQGKPGGGGGATGKGAGTFPGARSRGGRESLILAVASAPAPPLTSGALSLGPGAPSVPVLALGLLAATGPASATSEGGRVPGGEGGC